MFDPTAVRRSLLVALGLAVIVGTGSAQSRYEYDRGQCRLSFGNSVRHLAAVTALRSEICHRNRLRGVVPASVDCSDVSSWTLATYPAGYEAFERDRLRFDAESAACSPGILTTAEVGYTSCPSPCAALPVSSFPELGACMACLTASGSLTLLQTAHGTPPAPSTKVPRKCLESIGRGIVRYINKRMNRQHECQFLKDVGKPEYVGVDCADTNSPSHPDYDRSQRAVLKLASQIQRRCSAVDIAATLDTCGSDPASVHACVITLVDELTTELLAALFPPLPPLP